MRVAATVLAAVLLMGCSGDDAGDDPAVSAPVTGNVAATAPGLGSPFCDRVAEMSAALDADEPPDDVTTYLVDAYHDLLAVAPPDLVPDLEAMVAALSAPPTATDNDPVTTGTAPADDAVPPVVVISPSERVAEYVAEHCGRIDANPGPSATPPSGGYDTVADTVPVTSGA